MGAADSEQGDGLTVALSSGATIRVKPIPRAVWRRVLRSVDEPAVPLWTDSEGRTEPNPSDPDYLAALDSADRLRYERLSRLMLAAGLELVDPGPLDTPEDEGWSSALREAGLDVATSGRERWRDWLELYAMVTDEDLVQTFTAAQRAVGLLEWEVLTAMRFFPNDEGGGIVAGVPVPREESANGDRH
jgi:antitoxin component of MazEF toxin-antitoxin module